MRDAGALRDGRSEVVCLRDGPLDGGGRLSLSLLYRVFVRGLDAGRDALSEGSISSPECTHEPSR
jgi:hypothetical protein